MHSLVQNIVGLDILIMNAKEIKYNSTEPIQLSLPLQNQRNYMILGLLETTFSNIQSNEADSVNGNDPWVDSPLATKCPQRLRVPGAGEKGSAEAQSPGFPKEARGGHQSRVWKGTWLQTSEHQSMSSCYFLGFSRMFKNFPLVISLDSSSPSW